MDDANQHPPSALWELLGGMRDHLQQRGDEVGEERLLDFMTMVAAAQEAAAAKFRGDDEAMRFHIEVLHRCSATAALPDVEITD